MAEQQQNQEQQCIFCQIISKKIPSKIVYEDDVCMAIMDIKPATKGHVLLMPKKHQMIVDHMSEEEFSKLLVVAKNISNAMLKGLNCKGTTLFLANGALAGQKAPHVILHIIPRYEKDGLGVMNLTYQQIPEDQWNTIKDLVQSKVLGDGTTQKQLENKSSEEKEKSQEEKKPKPKKKSKSQPKKQDKKLSLDEVAEEKEESEEQDEELEEDTEEDSEQQSENIETNDDEDNNEDDEDDEEIKENVDLDDIADLFK